MLEFKGLFIGSCPVLTAG